MATIKFLSASAATDASSLDVSFLNAAFLHVALQATTGLSGRFNLIAFGYLLISELSFY
jgi:hypothetical protein